MAAVRGRGITEWGTLFGPFASVSGSSGVQIAPPVKITLSVAPTNPLSVVATRLTTLDVEVGEANEIDVEVRPVG